MGNWQEPVDKYPGVTPRLIVRDAKAAIEFYKTAFGAEVIGCSEGPDGRIWQSELRIGRGGKIFVVDEFIELGLVAPTTVGATPVSLHMYVPDVDSLSKHVVAAGARSTMPAEAFGMSMDPAEPQEFWWGDRYFTLQDPFGYRWELATRRQPRTKPELEEGMDHFFETYDTGAEDAHERAAAWHKQHPEFNMPNTPPRVEEKQPVG